MTLTITHYADFSTAHITKRDSEILTDESGEDGGLRVCVDAYEYGWRVYTGSNDHDYTDAGLSPAFLKLIREAREEGCDWITLDCDGQEYDHLERFDW